MRGHAGQGASLKRGRQLGVVIEEMLPGEEVSLLCVCDGEDASAPALGPDHQGCF